LNILPENVISDSDLHSDDQLQLVTGQIFVGQAILVAHQLGFFTLLARNFLSLQEIATHLGLQERATQALIACAGAHNLIECNDGLYQLSSLGKVYLDDRSEAYYGKVLDLLIQENGIMNFDSIKKSIQANLPQIIQDKDLFGSESNLSSTKTFIDALHYKAIKPAFHWNKIINLKNKKKFIDLGGGSGIHTIAACLNNPALSGIVCDRPLVVPLTKKYIQNFDLEHRIDAFALDLWLDPFPKGDIYFLGDIFHDWTKEKCEFLADKCFNSLPKNGQIILHEMLFNDDKTGPFLTAAYNMKMMLWTEGQQYSKSEVRDILKKAGFNHVQTHKSLGNWSVTTGVKS
jgi:hypothetical protein